METKKIANTHWTSSHQQTVHTHYIFNLVLRPNDSRHGSELSNSILGSTKALSRPPVQVIRVTRQQRLTIDVLDHCCACSLHIGTFIVFCFVVVSPTSLPNTRSGSYIRVLVFSVLLGLSTSLRSVSRPIQTFAAKRPVAHLLRFPFSSSVSRACFYSPFVFCFVAVASFRANDEHLATPSILKGKCHSLELVARLTAQQRGQKRSTR